MRTESVDERTICTKIMENGRSEPFDLPPFLLLPGELRNLIYAFYFEDATIPGATSQKQTKNSTSLLFVNRPIHTEALDIMYKTATLSIDLGKDHAPSPPRDIVWMYSNEHLNSEDWCSVQPQTLQRYHNTQLIINTRSEDLTSNQLKYAYPQLVAYLTELQPGQHIRVKLNLTNLKKRNLFSSFVMSSWKQAYAEISFSKSRKSHIGDGCTDDECTSECQRKKFEKRACAAETFADLDEDDVEASCTVMALVTLGQNARKSGARFYIEDGNEGMEAVTADNAVDLVEQAKGLDKGNDLSVVLEGCWKE